MSGSTILPATARQMLSEPVIATLCTVGVDGFPHATPVWVDVEGDLIAINTARGRSKTSNLTRDSRVAVSAVDAADPFRAVAVQGKVVEMTEEGADAHIDALATKYLGLDEYPLRQPGERRVIVRIEPTRVLMAPADPEEGS